MYFVAHSPTSGRMRYAPTPVRLIVGRGGDFRCAFAHVRAYAIRPYSFWRNLWRASNNGERYFSTEKIYASSYRYFLPTKNFGSSYRYFLVLQIASARHTGSFWCFILHRLVIPVVFDVAICISSSYRYFLVLQIASARRTGTFWCCKLHRLVVPVLFDVTNCISLSYRYFLMNIFTLLNRTGTF